MSFYNSTNDHANFCISFTANPLYDFGIYAKGYRLAADRLTKHLRKNVHFSDYEAYPIVFLYRHAFELNLKNIIYKVAMILAFKDFDNIDSSLYNTHSLIKLSQQSSKFLLTVFPTDQQLRVIIDQVCQTAVELTEIDSTSYSYRYPIDRNGEASTKHHQVINLTAFAKHMN